MRATSPTLVTPVLGVAAATDLTLTGSAASTPDANTLTKDHMVGARCIIDGTGTPPTYTEEINFTGAITDNATGNYTLTIDRDFAAATYSYDGSTIGSDFVSFANVAVGTIDVIIRSDAGASVDNTSVSVVLTGDQ